MHIVRFVVNGGQQIKVGILVDQQVIEFGIESISELMHLPLDELRARCESVEGRRHDLGMVRLLPPVDGLMEVWAAGVTYKSSQLERMRESRESASVYDRVYTAERPELFVKSSAWRVVGDGEPIAIREDSAINVPEPELALVVNAHGEIVGYSVCNDVSSRSIEGENPLYLPQAKVYLASCAVGFGIRPLWEVPDPRSLQISLKIRRDGATAWEGAANTDGLHRDLDELVGYLLFANRFPDGVVLSTGTSLVPALPFSLAVGDLVEIEIPGVGSLVNPVVSGRAASQWLVEAIADVRRRPATA
ncbi:MAG: fumarylacetoacetate hydrolase family protein [Acidimicrobiales bacterium]|jgi:2-dehydro-3-deoxy-D-arabinonate dehydratase